VFVYVPVRTSTQPIVWLADGVDAPGHFGSAHHAGWNEAYILQELYTEVGVAE